MTGKIIIYLRQGKDDDIWNKNDLFYYIISVPFFASQIIT